MKFKIHILLILILFSSHSFPTYASLEVNYRTVINNYRYPLFGENYLNETPAYTLKVFSDRSWYDRNDEVRIKIYVTGEGEIVKNRITFYIPEEIIFNNETILYTIALTLPEGAEEGDYKAIFPRKRETFKGHFTLELQDQMFIFPPKRMSPLSDMDYLHPTTGEDLPPAEVTFIVKEDAPSGDHKIDIILRYKSKDGSWYISKEHINIHIRSYVEKWGLTITTLIALSLAIFSWFLSRMK